MPSKKFPEHDINQVFDYIHSIVYGGHAAEEAKEEMSFLNRLFSALPVDAVEYGMQFLHGRRDLPVSCDEILPLYIRFTNLVEYCEIIEKMQDIPSHPTPEELQMRIRMNQTLDELEKTFCEPLLGYTFNHDTSESAPEHPDLPEDAGDNGSALHLMNDIAPVFYCRDILRTALFYEEKLGFHASHLDDESMPHIRLLRDNIEIVLVSSSEEAIDLEQKLMDIRHGLGQRDLYIFASEPMMLQMELESSGVTILTSLEDADRTPYKNREFTFTDIDGRHICVSQRLH